VSGPTVAELVRAFDNKIPAELRRVIEVVKKENPESYRATYQGKHVLEIVFASFEKGVPVLAFRDYQTNALGELMKVTKRDCPGVECAGPVQFCLGECSEVNLAKRNPNWQRGGLIPTIRRLINFEVDAYWQVGPPIDILQIDKNGPRWIGQDPQSKCPPITQ
jgi:hypothetical protein